MSADVKPRVVRVITETAQALTSTGDKATLSFPESANIVEIGVVIATVTAPTGTPVVAFDRRITAGSDTGRVDAGIGSITKAVASLTAGKILRKQVSVEVSAGDQVVVEVTTAAGGAALTAIPYVVYYLSGSGAVEGDYVASA